MGMNNLILLLVQQGEAWNLKIFKYTVLKLFIENLYIYTVYFNIFTPPFSLLSTHNFGSFICFNNPLSTVSLAHMGMGEGGVTHQGPHP